MYCTVSSLFVASESTTNGERLDRQVRIETIL